MEMTPIAVGALAGLLERATGQQLGDGRRWRLGTTLSPLLRDYGYATVDALAVEAARAPGSAMAKEVVEALLNHETSFYRDMAAFNAFVGDGLDVLRVGRVRQRLHIWSAGCATGQEPYSLALTLSAQRDRWEGWDVALTGTDISHRAIARAKDGLYSHFEAQRGLPITTLIRAFDGEGESWRIKPAFRRAVSFRQHNLLDAAPMAPVDAILCRNVLLYFAPARQADVLARLHDALSPGGLLMLGAGEVIPEGVAGFAADPALKGLYRRQ